MKLCKFHDSSEIPDFQWNAPQKHQEMVTFIKGSGVGPGEARSAQGPWRSTKCVSLQQETQTTYWLSCFAWRFSHFRHRCEKPWYSYRIIEVSAVPFPAKSSFSWKSWFPVKFTDFHENHRISPQTAIFTKMLVSQKGAPRKHQEMVTFIKGSGAGGGGSWILAENMEILEIRRKWQKNAEILEFHQKREKTENRGNGKTADSWKSGAPNPAPLPGRLY